MQCASTQLSRVSAMSLPMSEPWPQGNGADGGDAGGDDAGGDSSHGTGLLWLHLTVMLVAPNHLKAAAGPPPCGGLIILTIFGTLIWYHMN